MDQLERDLAQSLRRQVAAPPPVPHLADNAIRRGRRTRRLQVAAAVTAVAAVVSLASALIPQVREQAFETPASSEPISGPPRVPLFDYSEGGITDWHEGERRVRLAGQEPLPIAAIPAGILLWSIENGVPSLAILGSDRHEPRTLMTDIEMTSVAVSQGGRLVTFARKSESQRQLVEMDLSTGHVLRSVRLAPPLVADEEPVQANAYSDGRVLLTLGEPENQRVAMWEAGDDGVIGVLDRYERVLGGSPDGGAFGLREEQEGCTTEIAELRTGGRSWRICHERFVSFSPDGAHVLTTNANGDDLVVRESDDGTKVRTIDIEERKGPRSYGWESGDTLLYTSIDDGSTVVTRCEVTSGRCAKVATFPGTERIPTPLQVR